MSSAEMTAGYVRRMIEKESKGWGDQENALRRLAAKYGVSFWTLNNLRIGRAKTVDASLFSRIRVAYLDLCERQLALLQHEISLEKARKDDGTFNDLAREAEALVARIKEQREAVK